MTRARRGEQPRPQELQDRGGLAARWLAVLDSAGASAARRVQRGHGLARRGAVEGLEISAGQLAATVVEDRGEPLAVRIGWPTPSEEAWRAATATLHSELRFTAALLEGTLNEELLDALARDGVDLVPDLEDLELRCPCGERARLCRHVAAVHVAAATPLDRDLGLLLALRGRDRDALLREVRADHTVPAPQEVTLDVRGGLEAARGDLDGIALHPAPADDPASLFRHLGPPPGVDDDQPIAEVIERAAAAAWRLAAGAGSEAADEELLLAELRAQRMASASSLAASLGRDPEVVRTELDRLYADGTVLRMGSGERARYRAAE